MIEWEKKKEVHEQFSDGCDIVPSLCHPPKQKKLQKLSFTMDILALFF